MSEVFSKEDVDHFFALKQRGWKQCTYRELSWARKLLLCKPSVVPSFYGGATDTFALDFAAIDILVADAKSSFRRKIKLV